MLTAQTGGPAGRQTEVAGSSFDALVRNAVIARDMVRAAPAVPVHAWLAPKYAEWGQGYSYLSSGNSSTDEVDMWEENVFHLALATASTEFLWWQPGHQTPGIGLPLLEKCLDELAWVTAIDQHGGSAGCRLAPLVGDTTAIEAFDIDHVLSGLTVSCADGFQREVYRFTPRCTKTVWCTSSNPVSRMRAPPLTMPVTPVGASTSASISVILFLLPPSQCPNF